MKRFSMKYIRYATGLFLLLGILALGGCADPLGPKSADSNGAGLLTVTLGDTANGGRAARTLYPAEADIGFQSYIISFSHGSRSHGDVTFDRDDPKVVPLDTDVAPWTITVTAYTVAGGSGTAAASGTASVTMDGNAQKANITLTPITGDGTQGTFSYDIRFPTTISSAALTITTAAGGAVTGGTITATDISTGTLNGTLNLDAGYYFMNLNLVKGTLGAGKTEVVHIYPGLTTEANYTFTDADLVPALEGGVSITGIEKVGSLLIANTGSPQDDPSYKWKWWRGDDIEIPNAIGPTYTLGPDDRGEYIKVTVSRAGYEGSVTSAAVGPVIEDLTGSVSISGDPEVWQTGQTPQLKAETASLGGKLTEPSYVWKRGDTADGAFEDITTKKKVASYTPVDDDVDKYIKVTVSREGYEGSVTSTAVGPVARTFIPNLDIWGGRQTSDGIVSWPKKDTYSKDTYSYRVHSEGHINYTLTGGGGGGSGAAAAKSDFSDGIIARSEDAASGQATSLLVNGTKKPSANGGSGGQGFSVNSDKGWGWDMYDHDGKNGNPGGNGETITDSINVSVGDIITITVGGGGNGSRGDAKIKGDGSYQGSTTGGRGALPSETAGFASLSYGNGEERTTAKAATGGDAKGLGGNGGDENRGDNYMRASGGGGGAAGGFTLYSPNVRLEALLD